MPAKSQWLCIALVTVTLPVTAHAQSPSPHYKPQPDTLYYETSNPYHMYWVRGTDTLGDIRRDRDIDRQVWTGRPEALTVRSWSLSLDVNRKLDVDTFELLPSGKMAKINGRAPAVETRAELVPPIPPVPLRAGFTWTDTLSSQGSGAAGQRIYNVVRSYRVERMTDSAGQPMVLVSDSGTVRYKDGFPIDSTRSVWLDVSGPMTERFSFDPANGRTVLRSWEMNLVGIGGIPNDAGGVDTVPAGLRSSEVVRLISRDKALVLTRPLPGTDTSFTMTQGPILLHTVLRGPDSVVSGFGRNDGLVGTATTRFANRRPTRYQALWTDSISIETRRDIVVDGSRLRLRGLPGTNGDSVLTAPTELWGIADYAMQEHLVPVLLAVPQDNQPRPFAIYRPEGEHWDEGTVAIRGLSDFVIVTLKLGDDDPQYLLITQDGDLLYAENSDPTGARREPAAGERQERLGRLMKQLQ